MLPSMAIDQLLLPPAMGVSPMAVTRVTPGIAAMRSRSVEYSCTAVVSEYERVGGDSSMVSRCAGLKPRSTD